MIYCKTIEYKDKFWRGRNNKQSIHLIEYFIFFSELQSILLVLLALNTHINISQAYLLLK